ncbi:MAG: phosphatidylglycerophosphatase A [Alphaproteobacteria bacterium]|nr:MAG: phosphatidylglycerophosphatase A [Alphaproteobacteria bacterium]
MNFSPTALAQKASQAILPKIKPEIRALPPETTMKDWRILTATWFGAGRIRPAPGTMGSIAAIPFGYIIAQQAGFIGLALAAIALLCIGTVAADFYGKKSGTVDDQTIVVDEVVGMWIAAIPAEGHWDLWLLGLVLFRIFDIWKPWPASWFDNRSKGGFDVMMDDVVAGIYAMFGVGTAALAYL